MCTDPQGHEPLLWSPIMNSAIISINSALQGTIRLDSSGSAAVAVQLNPIYLIMLRGQLDVGLQGSKRRCPH